MPKPQHVHYLRSDMPDGVAEAILVVAANMDAGALDLRSGSQSRDLANRYHAAIDGARLMERTAAGLRRLVGTSRLPG